MNKTLKPQEYYLALSFFIVSANAQREAREFEKRLQKIVKNDFISDLIYNPETKGTKEELDAALEQQGISIDWFAVAEPKKKIKENTKQGEENESKQ